MIHVVFLIRSLERGGAERQLVELVKGLDKTNFTVTIVTLYDGGALCGEIEGLEGVKVVSLGRKSRWDVLPTLWRLMRVVYQLKPHVVHGYMSVANELSILAGRMVGARVVWGLRASDVNYSLYSRADVWLFRIGAWLSRFADLIIVNSYAGKRHYLAHGYAGKRMVVVQNGINTDHFRPVCKAGQQIRSEWNITNHERLIGLVGRLDRMKDHKTFLQAAAWLIRARDNVRFVCVGDGPLWYKQELQAVACELDIDRKLIWSGGRNDMPAVYSALDICVSASVFGEGFSNVLSEAMACEIPCVATDVGDSALIVGRREQIVPPGDPHALMIALGRILDYDDEQRAELAMMGRQRIIREYGLQRLVSETETNLVELLACAN